ncbi:MAG: hypothetical protein LKJ75_02550 [Clostridia bacterium]|nr:hypothetical protein [Clostridia bacterium]MCI2014064.1 hypothetical protein [Clostridia bacterium]
MAKSKNDTVSIKKEQVFVKSQILKSKKYTESADLLNAVLDDGRAYTFDEIDKAIENFKKKNFKKAGVK